MDANARREIDRAVGQLLIRVADAVADDARRFVPVDTGRLRASIERGNVQGTGNLSIQVTAAADHAGYVELGTSKMRAQAYLRPALLRKRVL